MVDSAYSVMVAVVLVAYSSVAVLVDLVEDQRTAYWVALERCLVAAAA